MTRSERTIEIGLIRAGFVVVAVAITGLIASVCVRRLTNRRYVRAHAAYGAESTDETIIRDLVQQIDGQLRDTPAA